LVNQPAGCVDFPEMEGVKLSAYRSPGRTAAFSGGSFEEKYEEE
jgi:hypothetical protein